jgi:hypothetical protein
MARSNDEHAAALAWRVDILRQKVPRDRPVLVADTLVRDHEGVPGRDCLSCGEASPGHYRCALCIEAMRLIYIEQEQAMKAERAAVVAANQPEMAIVECEFEIPTGPLTIVSSR